MSITLRVVLTAIVVIITSRVLGKFIAPYPASEFIAVGFICFFTWFITRSENAG